MLVALDIGTSKIVVLVADYDADNDDQLEILSFGICSSKGMKKGIVVDIEEMVDSIRRAVEEAELMLESKITSVYVGVAGNHIHSLNCHGAAPIRDGEVSVADVERAIETAQAIQIAGDQQVLHVLPRDFKIDDEPGIRNPEGMSGYRLEASVHLITGGVHPIQNIIKCVERCGLKVTGVVLEPIASGLAVLTADERELGVCLVDIGGGTTDIAVFTKGEIMHTAIIPIAGDHVTNDIAVTLRTPTSDAEELKLKYGCTKNQLSEENENIEVHGLSDDRPPTRLHRRVLSEIIEPRYEEIFSLVRHELQRQGFSQDVVAGVVLTGGSSKLEGIVGLAESIFNMPVRVGKPKQVKGSVGISRDPIYATGLGLLTYANNMLMNEEENRIEAGSLKGVWSKTKLWFQNNF